jgi:hypothetical protein
MIKRKRKKKKKKLGFKNAVNKRKNIKQSKIGTINL